MSRLSERYWDLITDEALVFIQRLKWIETDDIVGLDGACFAEIYNLHILHLRQLELSAEKRYGDHTQWPEGMT